MIVTVGYDPVEERVIAHVGGARPACDVPAAGLACKHFRDDGILVLELKGQVASLHFYDREGRPAAVGLAPDGQGRWDVIPGG